MGDGTTSGNEAGYFGRVNNNAAFSQFGGYNVTDSLVSQNEPSGSETISYLWHSVQGYSDIGTYYGNGVTDGPLVNTGFKPALVIVKSFTGGTGSWEVLSSAYEQNNPIDRFVRLDQGISSTSATMVDFCSNGFKVLDVTSRVNVQGRRYIYMAFAESPLKYSLSR